MVVAQKTDILTNIIDNLQASDSGQRSQKNKKKNTLKKWYWEN
jgi:hypothetical protein